MVSRGALAPVFQANRYCPDPPVAAAWTLASDASWQLSAYWPKFVTADASGCSWVGEDTIPTAVAVCPLAVETVTWYVPAERLCSVTCVVPMGIRPFPDCMPFVQLYRYGGCPPPAVSVSAPLFPPKHDTAPLFRLAVGAQLARSSVVVTVTVLSHPALLVRFWVTDPTCVGSQVVWLMVVVTDCPTFTVAVASVAQPAEVSVTVKLVFMAGLTVIVGPVVPLFHTKLPVPLAVRVVDSPAQICKSPEIVTCGVGLTVIVNVRWAPGHAPSTGVTVTVAVTGAVPVLTAVKLIFPVPLAPRPIAGLLLVQLKAAPVVPLKPTDMTNPLQTV